MALTEKEILAQEAAQTRLNEKIAEYNRLTGETTKNPIDPKNYSDAAKYSKALNDELKKTASALLQVSSGLTGIQSQFKDIGKELNSSFGNPIRSATKSVNKIYSLTEQLSDAQSDLTTASVKQLKIDKDKTAQEFNRIKNQRDSLGLKLKELEAEEASLSKIKNKSAEENRRLKKIDEERSKALELKSIADDGYNEQVGYQNDINAAYDKTIERVENINSATGLTGKILEGIGGSLEKLGFTGFGEKVTAINQELKNTAFELTDNGERTTTLKEKFGLLTDGVGSLGTALVSSLSDPLVIAGLLISAFKKLVDIGMKMSQEITDLGRSMNMSRDAANAMFTSIKNAAVASGTLVGNTKDMLAAQMSISKIMGTRVEVTGKELEAQVALTKLAGLSNEQAAELYKYSILTGESSEDLYDSISDQGDGLLNNNEILKEALEIEGQLAAQYKNDPKLIAQAVRQVKLLGISLQQAQSMGKSMLNFESSIESELEAQLLTGKSLNLSKVRALALAGKTAQAAELALQQAGSSEEFTNMNVIAQESLAEAMGLSTDELAKYLRTQELINKLRRENPGLSKEQATLEAQRQNMSAGEKLAASMTKIQDAFAAIVGPMITPVVDMFSTVVGGLAKMPNLMKIIGGGAAVLGALALFTKGIPAIFGYFKSQVTKPTGLLNSKINTKIDQNQIQQIVDSVGGGSGGSGGTGGTGGKGSKGKGRASKSGLTKSGAPDMRTKAGRQMASQSKMKGGGMMSKLGGAGGAIMSGLSMAAQAAPIAMSMGGRSMEEAGAEAGNRTKETVGSSVAQAGDVGVAKQATGLLGGITGKAGALLSKLSPGAAVKKIIGNFGPKIMKSLPKAAMRIPLLGAAIETIFASKDIAAMMSSGMPEDDIHQDIGRRSLQAIGGILGGGGASLAIQAANIVPGLGVVLTPLAGLAGDFIGRSLGGLLADASPSMAGSVGKGISNLFGQSENIKKGDKIQNAAGKISNPEKQTIKANDFTIQTNPADTLVMAGGTQFGKETNDLLTSILNAVQSGGDVYIDGSKAGEALVMGTYKAS